MALLAAVLVAVGVPALDDPAQAAGPIAVVPAANATVEGDRNNAFPFSCASFTGLTSQRYQQVYEGTAVGSGVITQLAFRPDGETGAAFGPTTIPGVTITLSTTPAAPGAMSTTFADNVGADVVTVYSGDLTLGSANAGDGPRDFDVAVALQTAFAYDSSLGNLLLDVTVPTCVVTTSLDAASGDAQTGRTYTLTASDATSATADFADVLGLVTQFTLATSPATDTDMATGGGYFNDPDRTSFAFSLIPQGGGTFRGRLQLRRGGDRFDGVTATAVTKPASGSLRWSGTGRWNGISGYTYEITVVDEGTPGKHGDTINVRIRLTTAPFTVVYATTTPEVLTGGNIVVGG